MKSEDKEKESEHNPKFRTSLVQNLLDREIGTQQRKYGTIKDTYRHPYQLLAAARPVQVHDFVLNSCEQPSPNPVKFDTLVDCLGFSPDGKHLAFHSHARTALSILNYSGVEGGKTHGRSPPISHFFATKEVFSLTEILSAWNYDNGRAYGSWWTDDSSTIVIQLKVMALDREDLLRLIGEEMDEVNDALSDERAQWRVVADSDEEPAPEVEPEVPAAVPAPEENLQQPVTENNSIQSEAQQMNDSEMNAAAEASANSEGAKFVQYGETSRTIPYWLAMESASEMSRDARKAEGQTSRTMPVYHALTSSIIPSQETPAEEESADQQPCTSSSTEPGTSERETRQSLADILRSAVKAAKNGKGNNVEPESSSVPSSSQDTGCAEPSEHLQKWIAKSKKTICATCSLGYDKTNRSGLGYSSPSSLVRKAHRPTEANYQASGSFADRLRAAIDEQRVMEPPPRRLPFIEEADQSTFSKISFVFLAYNVKTGRVAPLLIENVFRKFEVHMRDRTLTVAYKNDFIDTYHLLDKEIRWSRGPRFRLANLNAVVCPQYYRPNTVPGMPSTMPQPDMEGICGELYNFLEFHSPVQQSIKALLYRDMKGWFGENEVFRTEQPELTRCHMIEDDILALTLTFHSHPSKKPIHHGAIVNLADQSFKLYPDYLKFMQILFKNHISDLLPRHWTYLNPSPVIYQEWFKESLIDVNNPEQMNNYSRLKRAYDTMCENWCNNKSASNPFTDGVFFTGTSGVHYLAKYAYDGPGGGGFSGVRIHEHQRLFHVEKYHHPTDPLILWHHLCRWFVAIPKIDPENVIIPDMDS